MTSPDYLGQATAGPERWWERAACRDIGVGIFFPVEGVDGGHDLYAEARAVCSTCTVRTPCLDYALRLPIAYGFVGGLDEHERRALRRRMK